MPSPACRRGQPREERRKQPVVGDRQRQLARRSESSRSARRNTRSRRRWRRARRRDRRRSRAPRRQTARSSSPASPAARGSSRPTVLTACRSTAAIDRADDRRARNRASRDPRTAPAGIVAHFEPEKRPERERDDGHAGPGRTPLRVGRRDREVRRREARTGPPTPMTTSGRIFSTVVTTCTPAGGAHAGDVDRGEEPQRRDRQSAASRVGEPARPTG